MKKYRFIVGDAGTYMMNIHETTTRWCIRHPKFSYTKNPSVLYDCYIVGLQEKTPNDVKYLQSFKYLKEAKSFLHNLCTSRHNFYSLEANESSHYTKNYHFK